MFIMKLNLPTTLTGQKMTSLFLLTFLQVNKVKTGQNFSNCLANRGSPSVYGMSSLYDLLLMYNFNADVNISSGGLSNICCSSSQCLYSATCDNTINHSFYCKNISA